MSEPDDKDVARRPKAEPGRGNLADVAVVGGDPERDSEELRHVPRTSEPPDKATPNALDQTPDEAIGPVDGTGPRTGPRAGGSLGLAAAVTCRPCPCLPS